MLTGDAVLAISLLRDLPSDALAMFDAWEEAVLSGATARALELEQQIEGFVQVARPDDGDKL